MERIDTFSSTTISEEQISSDSASVSSVMTTIITYQENLRHSWFTLLESQFKVQLLGCHLAPHILKKVAHVVAKMLKVNTYDTLKHEVLTRTSNSQEAQFS